MMRRSLLTSLFILIATATLAASPPVNPADALAFMHQLWDQAAELLNGKTDPAIRRARFRQLFHEDFDGAGIARFVLGSYWRSISEQEQREFVKLFEDYVVYVYTARLATFGGFRREFYAASPPRPRPTTRLPPKSPPRARTIGAGSRPRTLHDAAVDGGRASRAVGPAASASSSNGAPPKEFCCSPALRMAMQCRAARGDKGNSPVGLQAD